MNVHQVSIIMPSYNASRFIADAIRSVQAQICQEWELLIVDDGSSDHSIDIINRFASEDQRIRLFKSSHQGAAEARNIAIRQARGRYIAFLDSDDVWEENKLAAQLAFMEKRHCAFVFSSYYTMDEDGRKTGKTIAAPPVMTYHRYLKDTIIGCLTVMIDRQQTGNFEMPVIRSSHDMALWLHIMKQGFTAYGMPEVLAGYRLVASSNTAKKRRAAYDVWRVYRDIEHLSLPYAALCFCGYVFHAIKKRL